MNAEFDINFLYNKLEEMVEVMEGDGYDDSVGFFVILKSLYIRLYYLKRFGVNNAKHIILNEEELNLLEWYDMNYEREDK